MQQRQTLSAAPGLRVARSFRACVWEALLRGEIPDTPVVVLVIELDTAALPSALLQTHRADLTDVLTERLLASVPSDHAVARVDWRRFAVLLKRGCQHMEAAEQAGRLAIELAAPQWIGGTAIRLPICIGVATSPPVARSVNDLLLTASTAAKRGSGRRLRSLPVARQAD